nr:hypothetical protein [Neisseria sicca]
MKRGFSNAYTPPNSGKKYVPDKSPSAYSTTLNSSPTPNVRKERKAAPLSVRWPKPGWPPLNQLSHSTLSRYRGMPNSHVLPKIGDIPIDRIQYSTLAGLLATLDCSANTRNNIATVIRQPFVLALRNGRIKDNPAQHLTNAKVQKEPPDPFTLEEAEAILGYLKNKPVFHNYFELAFYQRYASASSSLSSLGKTSTSRGSACA